MLFSVTLYGNRALVSHAIKRRYLYPQRNKNIIQRPPTGTLPCKLWHAAILQQVCAGLTAAGTPHLPPVTAWHSRRQWPLQLEMMAQASAMGGKTDIARASAKNQVSSFEPALRGQGRDGALSTLLQVFSVRGCSQGLTVACLHSRLFTSWSYSVKLERWLIAEVGANELWYRLKT